MWMWVSGAWPRRDESSQILCKCSQSHLCTNSVTSTQIRFAFSFNIINISCVRQPARIFCFSLLSFFLMDVENHLVCFQPCLLGFFLFLPARPHLECMFSSEHPGLRSCFDYQINQCIVLRRVRLDTHGRPLDTRNALHCSSVGCISCIITKPFGTVTLSHSQRNWNFPVFPINTRLCVSVCVCVFNIVPKINQLVHAIFFRDNNKKKDQINKKCTKF